MAKAKLQLSRKSDADLITLANGILHSMSGNSHFPDPDPSLAEIAAAVDDFSAGIAAHTDARNAAKTARAVKARGRRVLADLLTDVAAFAERKAKRDEAKLLSAGIPVRDPSTPLGLLPAPSNLLAAFGDGEGKVVLTYDPVAGSRSYEIQCKIYGTSDWQNVKMVTRRRAVVTGLTPGANYAFRVRAVGTAGPGAWSDEAVRRAP